MSNGSKTFKRITNDDIYEELKNIKEQLGANHEEMRTSVVKLDGRARLNFYLATSAMSVAGFSVLLIIAYMFGITL